jgi:hypothetical protein
MTWEGWNEDNIATLTKLWADGHVASDISKALGISRSGVLGKIHRLGLPLRSEGLGRADNALSSKLSNRGRHSGLKPKAVKPAPSGGVEPAPAVSAKPLPKTRILDNGVEPVAFADLPFRGACKFPVAEAPEGAYLDQTRCCAAPTVDHDHVYCAEHTRLALTSDARRKREAAAVLEKKRASGERDSFAFRRAG